MYYEKRTKCYAIIFEVLQDLDSLQSDDSSPGLNRLRTVTYELVYGSDDELFHQSLYDWYVSRGQSERLLEVILRPSLLKPDSHGIHSSISRTTSNYIRLPSQSPLAILRQKRKLPRRSPSPPRPRKLKFPHSTRRTHRIPLPRKKSLFRPRGTWNAQCLK